MLTHHTELRLRFNLIPAALLCSVGNDLPQVIWISGVVLFLNVWQINCFFKDFTGSKSAQKHLELNSNYFPLVWVMEKLCLILYPQWNQCGAGCFILSGPSCCVWRVDCSHVCTCIAAARPFSLMTHKPLRAANQKRVQKSAAVPFHASSCGNARFSGEHKGNVS